MHSRVGQARVFTTSLRLSFFLVLKPLDSRGQAMLILMHLAVFVSSVCNEPALATRIWRAHSPAWIVFRQGARAGVAGVGLGSWVWGPSVDPIRQILGPGYKVGGSGLLLQNVKPLFIPYLSSWLRHSWWWVRALPAPALGSQGRYCGRRWEANLADPHSHVCPSHPAS